MNGMTNALLAYVELGLIVALAYLLLRVARRALQSKVDPARMIRVGRVLFAVMLLAPFAAHGLLSIPSAAGGASSGAASVTLADLAARLRGLSGLISSRIPGAGDDAVGAGFGWDSAWFSGATWVLGALLLAGLALAAVRVLRRIRVLQSVVRSAVPFRRIGRVSIVVSDDASVPFSTAIFGRAHVVLPVGLLRDATLLRRAQPCPL